MFLGAVHCSCPDSVPHVLQAAGGVDPGVRHGGVLAGLTLAADHGSGIEARHQHLPAGTVSFSRLSPHLNLSLSLQDAPCQPCVIRNASSR